ncbi:MULTISPECIES: Ku protein [unclassified Actinotalea]|uniref:non-homologous end joining protein Ku n=1 Tax=unclassified Actinotalea TaxID=2638618 RepID=UPI0015F6F125|nr:MULTISPECIES: Ku protein [unclassified Actinotalea]
MRAIWKGAVAFGLVNVPVKLYAATGEHSVPLHQVHREDGGRIRYKKVCSVDGEEVPYGDIAKGYETDDGRMVVLTDEDLDDLPLATEREIAVEEFVPSDQVDPIMLGKTYYLEPEKTAAKPYALLREALKTTDRMAVVKVALRQRESMAVLRVRDDVICLQTLLWPDEVRSADFPILEAEVQVRPQELQMASSLVESLAADFDPSAFEDRYQAALESLIEAKVSSGTTIKAAAGKDDDEGSGGEVVDLLSALQRSVEKARGARAGSAAPAEPAAEPAPKRASRAKAAPKDDEAAEKPKRASRAKPRADDAEPAKKTTRRRAS